MTTLSRERFDGSSVADRELELLVRGCDHRLVDGSLFALDTVESSHLHPEIWLAAVFRTHNLTDIVHGLARNPELCAEMARALGKVKFP